MSERGRAGDGEEEREGWCCRLVVGGSACPPATLPLSLLPPSLHPDLFNHFFYVELASGPMWCCSPFLKQVSQMDSPPLMKAKLWESLKDTEDQHSPHSEGEGRERKLKKKQQKKKTISRDLSSPLSLKDMLMKLCSISRYFSSQAKMLFMVFVTFIWWECSIRHVFCFPLYAPFHGYKHMFEAVTMILGGVTLPVFFPWHFTWHIEPLCFESFLMKLQHGEEAYKNYTVSSTSENKPNKTNHGCEWVSGGTAEALLKRIVDSGGLAVARWGEQEINLSVNFIAVCSSLHTVKHGFYALVESTWGSDDTGASRTTKSQQLLVSQKGAQ